MTNITERCIHSW